MDKQLIFGLHTVKSVLKQDPKRVQKLYLAQQRTDQRIQAILTLADEHHIALEFVSHAELDRLAKQGQHQGIVASVTPSKTYTEDDLELILDKLTTPAFLLVLDGIQDPHNLGACLRTADAAGVHAVIAPKDRAASLTPVARKVASGAAEFVPFIQVTNLARSLRLLQKQGIWVYGTADDAETAIFSADLSVPLALVLGAEGKGMRRLSREHCDVLFSIPMAGSVSSLNVSVAAGVCLFEAVRQRRIQ